MIDFETLLEDVKADSAKAIAQSTYDCYEREIEHYQFIISQIPNADPPFPPTIRTITAYLENRKHYNCTYSTIKK